MIKFLEKAVEEEIDSISIADHKEHGAVLCSSWPVARVGLEAANKMVTNFIVKVVIMLVIALLSGLVNKFCKPEQTTDHNG